MDVKFSVDFVYKTNRDFPREANPSLKKSLIQIYDRVAPLVLAANCMLAVRIALISGGTTMVGILRLVHTLRMDQVIIYSIAICTTHTANA